MKKIILILLTNLSLILQAQNILGIDISHYQGAVNWTQVYNDGKVFAYVKATEGYTYNDPRFVTNMNNGNNAGVVMGAYHFARPDNNSAIDEANHFVSIAGTYIGDGFLPPVLDLEDPNSNTHLDQLFTSYALTQWVLNWLTEVENQTGIRPIIYTNSHYAGYLQSSVNVYDLWIAKPDESPTDPPSNLGVWNDWKFKQYSWQGSVNGISGAVDLDVFNGSMQDFNNMVNSGSIVEQNTIKDLKVYPIPATDFINLDTSSKIIEVKIFDINGRVLKEIQKENIRKINISNLTSGVYFLEIQNQKNEMSRVKVIRN